MPLDGRNSFCARARDYAAESDLGDARGTEMFLQQPNHLPVLPGARGEIGGACEAATLRQGRVRMSISNVQKQEHGANLATDETRMKHGFGNFHSKLCFPRRGEGGEGEARH